MEENLKIKTKDNHIIYGTLKNPRKNTKKIVMFVHGMTGNSNEHIFFNSAKEFAKQGIATFRFDLYSWKLKARTFDECTVKTHAEDINRVREYLNKKGFEDISIVGHSLGAPCILLSDTKHFNSIVFWDPVSEDWFRHNWEKSYNKSLKKYILDWGVRHICGREMIEDKDDIPSLYEITANLNKPLLIIVAEKGALISGCKKYFNAANKPKKLVGIQDATHCFDEEGAEERLIKATIKWVSQFF